MKTTFLNIVKTLFACVCAVVLNCVLIWMGVIGFATSTVLVVFAIAGYLGLDNTSASVEWRSLLCGLVALLYFYTIWQPEFWITVLSGAAIVAVLLKKKDYVITKYTGIITLYIVTWNIAFYIMGDTVLEWGDAVLVVTTLACCGIWIYHDKTQQQ